MQAQQNMHGLEACTDADSLLGLHPRLRREEFFPRSAMVAVPCARNASRICDRKLLQASCKLQDGQALARVGGCHECGGSMPETPRNDACQFSLRPHISSQQEDSIHYGVNMLVF